MMGYMEPYHVFGILVFWALKRFPTTDVVHSICKDSLMQGYNIAKYLYLLI